ncbi:MAG: extracellular solute-binding protein [Oscillospiraceae bacterium]|nr:extracellular solute-binding protein [Oscillospiraceae bacterium]
MKKINSVILFVLIFLLLMLESSCSQPDNDDNSVYEKDNPQTPTEIQDIPEETTVDPDYQYGGEQFDFNGETFTFVYADVWGDPKFPETENGDVVNDATYRCLIETEEFFNLKIQPVRHVGMDGSAKAISQEVRAGINSFDAALTPEINGLPSLVTNNYLYNWQKMPNVDFSQKYWNQSLIDDFTINGYLPFAANDFITTMPLFILFNKELIKDYGLENPYELVKSGKWTWTKFTEMAKKVSKDLTGDGQFGLDDLYGYAGMCDWELTSVMYSCDQNLLRKEDDGRYVLDVYTEKMQSIVETFYDLIHVGTQSYTYSYAERDMPQVQFKSGRVLFTTDQIDTMELRTIEFDFGILPYPKFDEQQEKHISLGWGSLTFSVPINVSDPERVGAVTEYMGAKAHELIIPATFDNLLRRKVARDKESEEMLDIIYGNIVYDFGMMFSNFNEMFYILPTMMNEKTTDLTSFYEKRASSVQRQYDKIYDACIANSEE